MSSTEISRSEEAGAPTDKRVKGTRITDLDEVLQRVVPFGKSKASQPAIGAFIPTDDAPATGVNGVREPTHDAFVPARPGSRDNGGLSTHREWKSSQEAYEDYIAVGREAIGTWGFPVAAADGQKLPVFDDGGIDDLPESHATVWFPDISSESNKKGRVIYERLGMELHRAAECRYRP